MTVDPATVLAILQLLLAISAATWVTWRGTTRMGLPPALSGLALGLALPALSSTICVFVGVHSETDWLARSGATIWIFTIWMAPLIAYLAILMLAVAVSDRARKRRHGS